MISSVYIFLSTFCNIGCKHCYLTGKQRKDKKRLEIVELKKIKDELLKFGKPEIIITGGEPLLHEIEYIEKVFEVFKDFEIRLETSLLSLFNKTENEKKEYYELFKKYNIGLSTSYEFYDVRKFNNLNENNIFINKVKNLKNEGVDVDLVFTITKKMQGKEKEVYNWLYTNAVYFNNIGFEDYKFYNIYNKNLDLKNSEISEILIEFYKLDKKNNFKVFKIFKLLKNNLNKSGRVFCYDCQNNTLVIMSNGEVNSCYARNTVNNFGNILENNILKILSNKKRLEWILFSKQHINICNNCEFKNLCCGGCPLKKKFMEEKNINDRNECSGYYPFLKYLKNN